MNRIKIDREFYTVARIGIIPYYKISEGEYRILLGVAVTRCNSREYHDFSTFVKRNDNYEILLTKQIKKIVKTGAYFRKVDLPIKKILNSAQKTVYLEWLIEVADPSSIRDSNSLENLEVIKVKCSEDTFEIEKKLPFNDVLTSIEKAIIKKLEKC